MASHYGICVIPARPARPKDKAKVENGVLIAKRWILASGATFKEISRGVFRTIEFLQPPEKLVQHFEDATVPMCEQILTLQREIQNLRRTRDLLLPRLLSGSINFDDLPAEGDDTDTMVAQTSEATSHIGARH